MSNDSDSLSNSTALGGRTTSITSNNLIAQGSANIDFTVSDKFNTFFLSDKLRKISDDISTIVRKRNGIVELTINNFSLFVIESMKIIEDLHRDMSGSDKRTVIIQVLAILFPDPALSTLIYVMLPPLIDGIVNLSKSDFKKIKSKIRCC